MLELAIMLDQAGDHLTMARCQQQGHMLMHWSYYHSSTSGDLSIQVRFMLPFKQQADTQTPL